MRVETIIPPDDEPLSLADAKTYCRVDADLTEEDVLIQSLITSVRRYIEWRTGRALAHQTAEQVMPCFPRGSILPILRFPLVEVISVTYTDGSGHEHALDADQYRVVTSTQPGALYTHGAWPRGTGPVRIRFECGHSPRGGTGVAEQLPEEAVTLMKFLVNHWYERRETVVVGRSVAQMPIAVESLLRILKVHFPPIDW